MKIKALFLAALAALCLPGLAHAADRRVIVYNTSSHEVYHIYATNRDDPNWGSYDLLGSETIPSGYNDVVNMSDGSGYCMMDLKAVAEDGSVWVKYNYNVCAATRWILND